MAYGQVQGIQPFQRPMLPVGVPRRPMAPQMPAQQAPASFPGAPRPTQPAYLSNVIQRGNRRMALRTSDNERRRAAILQHLMGGDPNQNRVAQLGAESNAAGGLSDALNQGYLQGGLADQQYGRQQDRITQQRQWDLADRAHQEKMQRFSIGGALGSLIGQGVGAFAGNYGARLGQGKQPPQQYGPYASGYGYGR